VFFDLLSVIDTIAEIEMKFKVHFKSCFLGTICELSFKIMMIISSSQPLSADFNNDHHMDIVVATSNRHTLLVLIFNPIQLLSVTSILTIILILLLLIMVSIVLVFFLDVAMDCFKIRERILLVMILFYIH
jgi:hypothetical protein